MRIATWNIGGGYIASKNDSVYDTECLEYFAEQLRHIRPDIAFFQESHTSERTHQPRQIATALGLSYDATQSLSASHLKEGEQLSLAIISHHPIIDQTVHRLRNPQLAFEWQGTQAISHDKGLLEARLTYNNTTIRALCGHMVPFRKFGKNFADEEYRDIREQVAATIAATHAPTIVGADMNHEDIETLLPTLFAQGFQSLIGPEATTPKGRRYDKILISPHWTATPATIVKGKADHYLCYADIELRQQY